MQKKEKMGILVSSHNLSELESFCTKIAIIQNGEMIENSSIEEAKKIDGKNIYCIEVDSVDKAKDVLNIEIEAVDENSIKINVEKEEIPQIVEKLVKADVKIYKVCEEKLSLEDAFLKKTGGNIID